MSDRHGTQSQVQTGTWMVQREAPSWFIHALILLNPKVSENQMYLLQTRENTELLFVFLRQKKKSLKRHLQSKFALEISCAIK